MTNFNELVAVVGAITDNHIEERLTYWNGVIDAWSENNIPRLQWWADQCLVKATEQIAYYSHKTE